MYLLPGQIVNDLVYFNSNNSANLQNYVSPALAVDSANQSNNPSAKTKS